MKEIWKDVPEYEGVYQVSSLGRVKSLEREDSLGRQVKEKILKTSPDGVGYCVCTLYFNSNQKTIKVHQLVAIAFLDHKPNGYQAVVDHIDNDKLNNKVENLQIISPRENLSKDRKGGSSQYVGVYWHKASNKWLAQILINGKNKYLGLFTNELQAAQAYQTALKLL